MTDIEIPLFKSRHGKRTVQYRFFEMLPAILSFGAIMLLIVLSMISPLWASVYILAIVLAMFIRSLGIAYRTVQGRIIIPSEREGCLAFECQ